MRRKCYWFRRREVPRGLGGRAEDARMRGSRGDGGSRERPHLRRACCTVRPKRPGAVLELELDKKNSENEMERARGYTWFFFSLVATVKEEKSEDKRGRRTEKSSILVSFSTLESFASSLEPSFFCPPVRTHSPAFIGEGGNSSSSSEPKKRGWTRRECAVSSVCQSRESGSRLASSAFHTVV